MWDKRPVTDCRSRKPAQRYAHAVRLYIHKPQTHRTEPQTFSLAHCLYACIRVLVLACWGILRSCDCGTEASRNPLQVSQTGSPNRCLPLCGICNGLWSGSEEAHTSPVCQIRGIRTHILFLYRLASQSGHPLSRCTCPVAMDTALQWQTWVTFSLRYNGVGVLTSICPGYYSLLCWHHLIILSDYAYQ